MQVLNYYYLNTLKQDFLTKYFYVNSLQIPFLDKIVLRINVKQNSLRNVLPSITSLFLIASQKPTLKKTKSLYFTLKIKSGNVVCCKVDLRKKEKFFFLEKLIFFIMPRCKRYNYTINQKMLCLKLDSCFLFKQVEQNYEYFSDLSNINIDLFFKALNYNEIVCFLNLLYFPLK